MADADEEQQDAVGIGPSDSSVEESPDAHASASTAIPENAHITDLGFAPGCKTTLHTSRESVRGACAQKQVCNKLGHCGSMG